MSQVDDPLSAVGDGDDAPTTGDATNGGVPTVAEPVVESGPGPTDDPAEATAGAEATAPGPTKKSRTQTRKEWRQVERARRYAARRSVRFPIFTRSVLLWMMIFALVGLAFGASGAFWWANFNTQVAQLRDDTKDFEQRSQGASAAIDAQRNQALTQINDALAPLSGVLSEQNTVKLAQNFHDSVWFVDTLDDAGKPSAGSAFALVSDDKEALMVTSYGVVKAAALQPGPEIKVRKGTEEVKAELWATDPDHDLALIRVPRGNIPVIEWASDDQQAKALGSRMFAVGGYGGNGAALSPGIIVDTNADGFQHTAKVGNAFRGGPVVNPEGKVLGVASLDYQPGGFDPGEVHFSVSINTVCEKVLACGGGVKKKKDTKDVQPRTPPAGQAPAAGPAPTATVAPRGGTND